MNIKINLKIDIDKIINSLGEIIENKPHARRFFYTLILLVAIVYTLTH